MRHCRRRAGCAACDETVRGYTLPRLREGLDVAQLFIDTENQDPIAELARTYEDLRARSRPLWCPEDRLNQMMMESCDYSFSYPNPLDEILSHLTEMEHIIFKVIGMQRAAPEQHQEHQQSGLHLCVPKAVA